MALKQQFKLYHMIPHLVLTLHGLIYIIKYLFIHKFIFCDNYDFISALTSSY